MAVDLDLHTVVQIFNDSKYLLTLSSGKSVSQVYMEVQGKGEEGFKRSPKDGQ